MEVANPQTWLIAGALSALFLGFVALVEIAKRKFSLSSEITRRVVHIGAGLCAWLDYALLPGWLFAALSLGGGLIFTLSYRANLITSVHNVVRKTYGELWLTAGIVGAYWVSLLNPAKAVFLPALLVVTLADSAAGLVSDIFRQPRKMWRGSAVFFVITAAILLVSGNPAYLALPFALALTAVERYSPLGSDNVTVPLTAAALLLL